VQKASLLAVTAVLCVHAAIPAAMEGIMEAGHWKRVRALADDRLRADPNDAFALYLSSKVAASFGDLEKGLSRAQRAVSLDPHNADYLAQLAEMHARLADHVSVVKQVLYVRALHKEIDAALAADPKNLYAHLVEIMFLSKAPMVAGGDRKRAHALAEELTRFNPGWGYMAQARLGEQEKDDVKIERALNNAVAAAPSSYDARFYLAKFYCCVAANRQLDAAERVARDAIKLDPNQSGGYQILARVFVYRQRWADLESLLHEAEVRVPEDLSPYYYAANTLFEQGKDFERAERFLRKYLSQEPEGRQPTAIEGRQLLARVSSSPADPQAAYYGSR
jgi:tetratricopeptide (TPR) repeat protein